MKKLAKVNKQQNVNLFVYICINQNFNVEPPIVPYSTPTTYKYPESISIHQKFYVETTCIYIYIGLTASLLDPHDIHHEGKKLLHYSSVRRWKISFGD